MNNKPYFSIVVPVFNEEENVARLHQEIIEVMETMGKPFEIIFVDDGSTDNTFSILKKLSPIVIVRLRTNWGQSAALDAGIKKAQGRIIFTLDGDGQNDPADFPKLLEKLKQGYDVVCGWRYKRKDPFLKNLVSKGAAFLRGILVKDGVHDAGCTLRVYKKECFDDLDLYGEFHRMIPALIRWRGFKITEIKVNHRPRRYGESKYNWKRTIKGFLDMVYIWFWRKYSARPLHLFGGIGIFLSISGGLLLVFLAFLKIFYRYQLSDKIWPLVGFFSLVLGVQLLLTGLLAANLVEIGKEKKYDIKEVVVNKK